MAPNAESHIVQIKIIKYILPGLFLLKIYFYFSHNEFKTPVKKGGPRFVSSQKDLKGTISAWFTRPKFLEAASSVFSRDKGKP